MQYTRLISNHFCFFFIILYIFVGNVSASHLAIVVQGVSIKPYDAVFEGIRKSYGSDIERIILYNYKGDLDNYIREKAPSILFAIGKWGLSRICSIDDIPIIYLMVLNPDPSITKKNNIAGIDMLVPARRKIFLIKKHIPTAKSVGVIYNPKYSSGIYRDISNAVREYHMRMVGRKVESAKDVVHAINSIARSIDIFMMIPDITLITPETLHFMSLFFLRKSIPVVTFSEKYLNMGAFMAIYPDPYEIGIQAGGLAKKILQKKIRLPVRLWPEKEIIKINPHLIKNLGFLRTQYRAKVMSHGINQ